MDILEQIKRQIEAYGKVPARTALVMYRDFDHWRSADSEGTIDDFRKLQVDVAVVAKTLSELGSKVVGVVYNETEYKAWLGSREDNQAARALWGNEKAAKNGGDWEWVEGLGWVTRSA